jgi:hypothetical protein
MDDAMTIPDPIARDGDVVLVLNYRKKPAEWERGEADDPVFYLGKHPSPGSWQYKVWLERLSATGRKISVTVGAYGIKRPRSRRSRGGRGSSGGRSRCGTQRGIYRRA